MKINFTEEKQGELIIFTEAFLWGLFPVITVLSLSAISPLASLGLSTSFAVLFFGLIITIKGKWKEIKNKESFKDILLATLFCGILYYFLYFIGLKYTTAGNASIIALTEIFFSFLLFHIWKKEYISIFHILGSSLMIVGAVIVLYPNFSHFNFGDILILIAAFLAPFGNFFQRKARKNVSSESILFLRSLISAPVIIFLAILTKNFNLAHLNYSLILFLIINGFFILGLSKILWLEGIHRISVTKANALNSLAPVITLIFAWIILHNQPTKFQLLSFLPMFFGILFLGFNKINKINCPPSRKSTMDSRLSRE